MAHATIISGRLTSEDFWPKLPQPVVESQPVAESHDAVEVITDQNLITAKRRMCRKTSPLTSAVAATASPPVAAVDVVSVPPQSARPTLAVAAVAVPLAVTVGDAPPPGLGCTRCRWGKLGCKTCAAIAFNTMRCSYVRVVGVCTCIVSPEMCSRLTYCFA